MLIPDLFSEFRFRTSKSSGKGGQHVNKTESKVELIFHPADSQLLSDHQKQRLAVKWASRTDENGFVHFTEDSERSQIKNRELVIQKFYRSLKLALKEEKKRKATKVPRSVKEKRVDSKKRRSTIKEGRRKPEW